MGEREDKEEYRLCHYDSRCTYLYGITDGIRCNGELLLQNEHTKIR